MDLPKPPSSPSGPTGGSPDARAAQPHTPDALPAGTRLDEYQIDRVLHAGGFSIIYLATDVALERVLAIEEYLPAPIAVRGDDLRVTLRSDMHEHAYERGLRAFTEEAELLARCDHPSLLRVYRGWQANGTAYRAMPYYAGTSLRQLRDAMSEPPDEASMRALLDGLLGALEALHAAGGVHRSVSPDSIILGPDDRPVLLGFDAARRAIVGDRAQALMSLVEPMFVTREQIAQTPEAQPGPWTDVYALAAVVRYCIDSRSQTTARLELADESLTAVMRRISARHPALRYSATFIEALDWALSPHPSQRPQSAAAFRAALHGERPAAAAAPARPAEPAPADAAPPPAPDAPASAANTVPVPDALPADVRAAIDRALASVDTAERFTRVATSRAAERPVPPPAAVDEPAAASPPAPAPARKPPAAAPAKASTGRAPKARQGHRPSVQRPAVPPVAVEPVIEPVAEPSPPPRPSPVPRMEEPVPWRPDDLEPAMYAEPARSNEFRPLAPRRRGVAGTVGRFIVATFALMALVAGGWKLNEMGAFEQMAQVVGEWRVAAERRLDDLRDSAREDGTAAAPSGGSVAPIVPDTAQGASGGGGGNQAGMSAAGTSAPGASSPASGGAAAGVDAAEAALARAEALTNPAQRAGATPGAAAPSGPPAATAAGAVASPPARQTGAGAAPARAAAGADTNAPASDATAAGGRAVPAQPPVPRRDVAAAERNERAARERREAAQREERDRQEAAQRAAAVRAQRAGAPVADTGRAEVADADPVRAFSSPRAACEPRTEFALYRCMQTQCERTQWFQHPQCIRLRLRDEID